MRTYGKLYNEDGTYAWVEVSTTPGGADDYVWLTTLIQTLKLNLGESPFFSQYGIPAYPTLATQIFPDYYVSITQQQFAPYFGSLIINKINLTDYRGVPYPAYLINVTTKQGVPIAATVPV